MATRQVTPGTMNTLVTALPTQPEAPTMKAPPKMALPNTDLMELIQTSAPNKDGLNLLYSLAGGLEFRIARLAAMATNVMAGALLQEDTSIGKLNEAISALDEIKNRAYAFDQAGITQHDMLEDLRQLVNFNTTVQTHVAMVKSSGVSTLPPSRAAQHIRWKEVIEMAAKPQAVEEWKYELSWQEYVEGCKGKTELTEAEHRQLEGINLAGKQQDWALYANQIIDTIESVEDEPIEFNDLSTDQQRRLLASISTEEKEAKFRTNALKIAKNPSDLHVRRQFISSFCTAARAALKHPKFQESYDEVITDTAADNSDRRHRATLKQQALDNEDALMS